MLRSVLLLVAFFAVACVPARREPEETLSVERGTLTVDGRPLSYFCKGDGSPTLILEAPSGLSNEEAYANILSDLAGSNRVCAYERAAYGGSAPLPEGMIQSLNDYARELDHLLALQTVPAPYILLGYSYGGFVSRYYAAHNPENINGIVLIDSPHVQWLRSMKAEMSGDDWAKVNDILQWFLDNRGHDAWISQFELEAAPPLRANLPIAVITRTQDHERMRLSGIGEEGYQIYNDLHYKLAPDLLNLSSRTREFTASESQHYIPDTEPEIVLEAVRTVVEMSREGD